MMIEQKLYCTFGSHPHEVSEEKYRIKCSRRNNEEGCEYLFTNNPHSYINLSELKEQIVRKKTIENLKQKNWNCGHNELLNLVSIDEEETSLIPRSELQREFKK